MQFGIQHGMGHPKWQKEILRPEAVIPFVQTIEKAGFTELGFTDHPAPSGRWVDADGEGVADLFTALSFCAAVSSKIRLLTWTLIPNFHNPLALAQRIATLDSLSGGRLTLGLGLGYLKSEFFAMGADFEKRHEHFDLNLQTVLSGLTGKDIYADGNNFSAKGTRVQPPVVQQPHPPLWFYGNSEFGLQRAAQMGQGWIGMFTTDQVVSTIRTTPLPDVGALRERLSQLDEALMVAGRESESFEKVLTAVVPYIDIRVGWDKSLYQEKFNELKAMGVTKIIVNAVGDDPLVSVESALKFSEDFILAN